MEFLLSYPDTAWVMSSRSNPEDSSTFGNPFHPPYIYIDSTQLPWVSADEGLYHFADSVHYNRIWKTVDMLEARHPEENPAPSAG